MTTRIVTVSGFTQVHGYNADAELTATATTTATAGLSRIVDGTLTATATTTAGGFLGRVGGSTGTTTATVTATAAVSSPTDISSAITEGATGAYAPGALIVPGYDQAYRVTVSNARFPSFPTIISPGVRVYMPTPSTPSAAHWLTITWTISDRSRRVFHDLRTNWLIDGNIIEPNPTVGATTTLTYAWDTAEQGWYVLAYTGSPTVRTHGPNESTTTLPLYFTPECRALGSFSTIKSAQRAAIAGLPPTVAAYMATVGTVVDIDSGGSDHLFETMTARETFDPAWQSGAFGFYQDPLVSVFPWVAANGCCDGQILLHELGHTWDDYGLAFAGTPRGVDPVLPGYAGESGTVNVYYDTGELGETFWFTPTSFVYEVYDRDGTIIWGGNGPRPARSSFSAEAPVRAIYNAVPDHPGSYVRSSVTEWAAQCFMLCWADHVAGYSTSQRDALVSEIGGASVLADFRAYAVSCGVLPSSW